MGWFILIVIVLVVVIVVSLNTSSNKSTNTYSDSNDKSQSTKASLHNIVRSNVDVLKQQAQTLLNLFSTPTHPKERIITDEFNMIANLIDLKEPVLLITGGAGTGKTTLIHWLIEHGRANTVVAFTGAAALNCRGRTIHSFFQLPQGIIFPYDNLRSISRESELIIKEMQTLVIDEISMVRADLIDAIDRRLREVRHNNAPFGGVQMVLVGDPYQLAPIVPRQEKEYFSDYKLNHVWKSGWFFDANVFQKIALKHVNLTHIFRQDESERSYIQNLNSARVMQNIEDVVDYFNSTCKIKEQYAKNALTLTTTNAKASERNKEELENLPGEIFKNTARATGAFSKIVTDFQKYQDKNDPDSINEMKKLPAPYELKLKVGALVMILVNDGEKRFVNGTTGIVKKFSDNPECINVQLSNGNIVSLSKYTWKSEKLDWDSIEKKVKRQLDGEFTQYPLTLAWAITTHKAQGRTLSTVHLDFPDTAFASGQTYVALSRTRKISDITLSRPLSMNDFIIDTRLAEWNEAQYNIKKSSRTEVDNEIPF